MSQQLANCLNFTYIEEGGYDTDPSDRGNWYCKRLIGTNRGISAPVLASWLGKSKIALLTSDYMKNLPQYVSDAIYQVQYWNSINGDSLPVGPNLMIFDFGVNDGVHESSFLLQQLLGFSGEDLDGSIGPVTLHALALRDASEVVTQLAAAQLKHYQTLGAEWDRYGAEWAGRTNRREQAALRLLNLSSGTPTNLPA